jgi:hypothetical protein
MSNSDQRQRASMQDKLEANTFIVRIWNEKIGENGEIEYWRGSIDHVGSSKRLYFYSLESISQFISEQTGVVNIHMDSWWHSFVSRFSKQLEKGRRNGKNRATRKI